MTCPNISLPPTCTVRLPNWVGDVCMALPALHVLRNHGVELTLVGRGWAQDLLAGFGQPVVKLKRGIWAAAGQWRASGNRHGLLLTNSLSSALHARLGGVRCLGYRGDGRRWLLARSLPTPVQPSHEVERLFALAQAWLRWQGISAETAVPGPSLALPLTPDHHAAAAQALSSAGLQQPFVVIAPLAVGTINGVSKVWPHFPALCQALIAAGHQLVTCPGPGEEVACAAAAPGAVACLGLGLGAYAALCQQASLVISNDSGPAHLASAVDAPTLAVFGCGQPWRTAPWGGQWIGSAETWPSVEEVTGTVFQNLNTPRRIPE
ncbi:MAG: lipopolysaccharide heptosyltransferase family protein [Planctomycetota bacterium]|nr:MAG: lipopolysaccharide heptosyltransferase family protein [Planctomycetota bacterium]